MAPLWALKKAEEERERERVPAFSPLVTYNRPQPALNRGFLDQDAE